MGEYVDCSFGYETFDLLYKNNYFVDKSNIIHELNNLLQSTRNCVCISKPRRFGKTSIAALIIAYYSKREKNKFKEIFDKLNISKSEDNIEQLEVSKNEIIHFKQKNLTYEETQGNYHTIYIRYSENITKYKEKGLNSYLDSIEKEIINELREISTDFKNIIDEYSKNDIHFLNKYLKYLHFKTKEKFIFVIDEWDYIFNHNLFTIEERNDYLSYLNDLLKNQPYLGFAYMTGILPIAEGISVSDLNFFIEFTMLNDEKYYKYFGFTEDEVKDLCERHKNLTNKSLKYEELEDWYNGYLSNNGEKIFNSWSIISAFENNKVSNYRNENESMKVINNIINFNIHGVKEDFLRLVVGEKIEIELDGYSIKNKQNDSEEESLNNEKVDEILMKNEMYSSMVVYGILTYNTKTKEISIPNKELLGRFKRVLKDTKDIRIYNDLKEISQDILCATLNKDTEKICNLLNKIHLDKVPNKNFYNYISLGFIVQYAYFDVQNTYNIEQEKETGKKVADFIFYPKDMLNGTVIILELKVGKSAVKAIEQIHERQYYNGLREKGYEGKLLLVGINVTKKKKKVYMYNRTI